MLSYQLLLPEPAPARIEGLLETCPQHIATTLDGGPCEMCVMDEMQSIEYRMEELEREGGTQTETYTRLQERLWTIESR